MYGHTIDYLKRIVHSELSTIQKLILVAIILRQSTQQGEWIKDSELVAMSSCSRRSIIRHRAELEKGGWLTLIKDDQNQLGYILDPCATESQLNEDQVTQSHKGCATESQPPIPCATESQRFEAPCDTESQPHNPGATLAQPLDCGHPAEYIEEFYYLAEQSLYWHEQCYTSARPACLYIDDLSEQPARPPESILADQEERKLKQADQEKGRQATTPILEDTAHEETPETLEDIFEADCTFFADQLKEHQVEHLSSTIPANVRASQKAFADSDTWRTFIEDKLCDLRPRISSDNHILSALRTDGKEWLVKRARNTSPHVPANIISLNDRKKPVKYPKARIPVEEGFGLGGKAHRFEKPDPDEPKRELTAVEQHLVQLMQLGGK